MWTFLSFQPTQYNRLNTYTFPSTSATITIMLWLKESLCLTLHLQTAKITIRQVNLKQQQTIVYIEPFFFVIDIITVGARNTITTLTIMITFLLNADHSMTV